MCLMWRDDTLWRNGTMFDDTSNSCRHWQEMKQMQLMCMTTTKLCLLCTAVGTRLLSATSNYTAITWCTHALTRSSAATDRCVTCYASWNTVKCCTKIYSFKGLQSMRATQGQRLVYECALWWWVKFLTQVNWLTAVSWMMFRPRWTSCFSNWPVHVHTWTTSR